MLSQAAVQKLHLWYFVVAFESPVELPLKRCGMWWRNNCTSVFENRDVHKILNDIYGLFPFFWSYRTWVRNLLNADSGWVHLHKNDDSHFQVATELMFTGRFSSDSCHWGSKVSHVPHPKHAAFVGH